MFDSTQFLKSLKPRARSAASLVEILITLTIFAIVATIAVQVLSNSVRSAKRIQMQAFLYNEVQSMMDQIGRNIEQSAVDYEAYYSRNVLTLGLVDCAEGYTLPDDYREKCWHTPNYGFYGKAFYHPGEPGGATGLSRGPDEEHAFMLHVQLGYGEECPNDSTKLYPYECGSGFDASVSPDLDQADFVTGSHPFTGFEEIIAAQPGRNASTVEIMTNPQHSHALCRFDAITVPSGSFEDQVEFCKSYLSTRSNEIILINERGDYRIIFALRDDNENDDNLTCESGEDCRIVMLEMLGVDTDRTGSVDGIVDTWTCKPEYDCPESTDSTVPDGELVTLEHFKPIIPQSVSVDSFQVFVTPPEDPYRAFTEQNITVQPQITFHITATLSEKAGRNYVGELPQITLQRTVSTGVYHEIVTYE